MTRSHARQLDQFYTDRSLADQLVAAGSIEERLLMLQQRKALLADAVLGSAAAATALQPADVQALLAPLDDGG